MLGGCGSNALQSIGRLLEPSSQEAAATAKAPGVERHSAEQTTTCQQTKQHETFTAEASHTYTQQATKMPDVRMLWVVDTSFSMKHDVLALAAGLELFVKRVADLAHVQVQLLMSKHDYLVHLSDPGAQFPALSPTFFDELPSSITHFDVHVDSYNSLNRVYWHLTGNRVYSHLTEEERVVARDFWPKNRPKIIKPLVVMSSGLVQDRIHQQILIHQD